MKRRRSILVGVVIWAMSIAGHGWSQSKARFIKLDAAALRTRNVQSSPKTLTTGPITLDAAVSPDGKSILSIDAQGQVWSCGKDGTSDLTIVARTDRQPACAAFAQDGKLLAYADQEGSLSAMAPATKRVLHRQPSTGSRIVALVFSADSNMLACAEESGAVRVWDVGKWRRVDEFVADAGAVQSLAFSPDEKRLATASFGADVAVHQLAADKKETRTKSFKLEGGNRVTAVAFSPGGSKLVVATSDGRIRISDLEGRGPVALGSHPFAAWTLAVDPIEQRLAAGSWDGTIRIWSTQSWEQSQSLKTHEESVSAIAADGEGGLISAGLDGRLLHWPAEVASISPSGRIAGRKDAAWTALYSPDAKRLFVGGRNERFELWDVDSGKLLVSRKGHPTTRCAAFSPDGKTIATGGDDGKIFLCDATTGEIQKELLRHPGAVSAVVFTHQGETLISGCDRGHMMMWNVSSGRQVESRREHQQQIYCANISPDGNWLVTGGGNWTTGDPGELLVWRLPEGIVHRRLTGPKLAVWSIVFMPDGNRFATSDSSGEVIIWDVKTFQRQRTLEHSTWIRPLAISPDGGALAVGRGDGSVRLWDTATWTKKASCEGHDSFTFWLEFSPDGAALASAGEDGFVRIWKTDQSKLFHRE